MYIAAAVMALGLFGMYLAHGFGKLGDLITFGIAGFVMITGYIFLIALCGSVVRDFTPPRDAGKLQGVRMVFSVLIPMLAGPAIGNAINKAMNIPLTDPGADAMTTQYMPAPEIYLVAGLIMLLAFAVIPVLARTSRKQTAADVNT